MKKVTYDGLTIDVDENALDNMELLEAIELSDENGIYTTKAVRLFFGDENKKKIYDHFRDPETNRVPVEKVIDFMLEAIGQLGDDGKN